MAPAGCAKRIQNGPGVRKASAPMLATPAVLAIPVPGLTILLARLADLALMNPKWSLVVRCASIRR